MRRNEKLNDYYFIRVNINGQIFETETCYQEESAKKILAKETKDAQSRNALRYYRDHPYFKELREDDD